MSRPLRVQYPGAIYHVISRGNGGNNIFEDKRDYLTFLEELKEVIEDRENTRKNVLPAGRLRKISLKMFAIKKKGNKLILKALQEYGYTQTEVGDFLDLHYSTVSKIIKNSKFKT